MLLIIMFTLFGFAFGYAIGFTRGQDSGFRNAQLSEEILANRKRDQSH